MRVHVVRIDDDLVVNTIIVEALPTDDAEHRYIECDGQSAGPGSVILSDGTVADPES